MKDTFNTIEIAPAVRLCGFETDRFTTSVLSIDIAVPLDPARAAVNSILPYYLMRACEDYPTFLEMRKRMAELYGATVFGVVGKSGDVQTLSLKMKMLSNKFALGGEDLFLTCAKQLFDMLFRPNLENGVFKAEDLEQEKRFAVERLEAELNDKRSYALRRLTQEMFKGDVYSTNKRGTVEELKAVTPESAVAAYHDVLKGGHIQINVVADVDLGAVANLFQSYISNIEREPYMLFTSILFEAEEVKRVEEELPVNQGKLALGYRLGMNDIDEDFPRFKIMSIIFGGATFSRLFMNVREKMSLCYYCSASLRRQKGFMIVQSGIENENAEVAIKEINHQLHEMGEGGVSDEDIEKARLTIKDMIRTVRDTPEGIESWISSQALDDEFESPEDYLSRLLAVTKEEVIASAKSVTLDTIYLLKGTQKEGE